MSSPFHGGRGGMPIFCTVIVLVIVNLVFHEFNKFKDGLLSRRNFSTSTLIAIISVFLLFMAIWYFLTHSG
jgi:hypothetical protein